MKDYCMFHIQDTKWGKNPESIDLHTICVDIDDYSFAMFDIAVSKGHKFNDQSIAKTIKNWKPVLKAMGVKGTVEIYGIEFPKTTITIKK